MVEKSNASNCNWRPDWRDKNQYPNGECDTLGEYAAAWAWEYLRRNTIYQEMYDQKIEEMPDLKDQELDTVDKLLVI